MDITSQTIIDINTTKCYIIWSTKAKFFGAKKITIRLLVVGLRRDGTWKTFRCC